MQSEKNMVLTKAEKQLPEVIRALDYGEVRVMIKDNRPIRVAEIRRSLHLPNEKHLYCGSTDLPLSGAGREELRSVHYDIKNDRFLTSSMK